MRVIKSRLFYGVVKGAVLFSLYTGGISSVLALERFDLPPDGAIFTDENHNPFKPIIDEFCHLLRHQRQWIESQWQLGGIVGQHGNWRAWAEVGKSKWQRLYHHKQLRLIDGWQVALIDRHHVVITFNSQSGKRCADIEASISLMLSKRIKNGSEKASGLVR